MWRCCWHLVEVWSCVVCFRFALLLIPSTIIQCITPHEQILLVEVPGPGDPQCPHGGKFSHLLAE